ncbi:MAG: hypothetical protein ABTQ29_02405 [Siculibacillus sp.]
MSSTGSTNANSSPSRIGVPPGSGRQKLGDKGGWIAVATIAYAVIWKLLRVGSRILRKLCPLVKCDCGDDGPPNGGGHGGGRDAGIQRSGALRIIPVGSVAATDLGALRVADGPGDAEETEVTGGTAVAGGGEKSPLPPPTMWPSWTSVRREIDRQRARPEGECVRVPRFFADGGERRWGFVFPGVRGVLRRI